ncbi:ATP-binding protein [Pontibacillus salicampi]|uniref:histidine kinase n=1 Tax=Pontibacillus salicampi TaxID=1449801 RepID=A0ABV6LMG3_9BACI
MNLSKKYVLIIVFSILLFPISYLGVNFIYYIVLSQIGNLSSEDFYTKEEVEKRWEGLSESQSGKSDEAILSRLQTEVNQYPGSRVLWVSDDGERLLVVGDWNDLEGGDWDASQTVRFMDRQQNDAYFTTNTYIDGSNHSGYVFLEVPSSSLGTSWEVLRDRYAFIWFFALGFIWMLFIFISWLFFKKISNRLTNMQNSMEISSNQMVPMKLTVHKEDEIGQLEHSFNDMVEKLNESRQKEKDEEAIRKQLVSSLSHDLRTPLSIINGHAHKMSQIELSDEVRDSVTVIQDKVAFLAELIDNLSSFTVLREGKLPMHPQMVDIVQATKSSLIAYYPILEEKGFDIDIDLQGSIQWYIDETWFRRILDNLFQNVKRHAGEGKYLAVSTTEMHGREALRIEDRGPGMRAVSDQKGTGIGLSIVEMMLDQMNLEKTVYDGASGTTILIYPKPQDLY